MSARLLTRSASGTRVAALMSAVFVTSWALAQEDHVVERPVFASAWNGGAPTPGEGYSDRFDRVVYDIGLPPNSGGDYRSSGTCAYDDVTFPVWAKIRGGITINRIDLGLIIPAVLDETSFLYLRVLFYPNHDSTVTTDVPPYSGTPLVWDSSLGPTRDWRDGHPTIVYGPPVTLDASNVFRSGPADYTCGVYEELYFDAAHTRYAETWQIVRRGLWTVPVAGSTDYFGWFSGTTNITPILNSNRSGGTAATARATYLALHASGYSPYSGCHGSCPSDVDDGTSTGSYDGGVTIDDLLFFLHMYANSWQCADTDNGTGTPDGGVTIDDLLYYLARFEAGC